MQDQHSIYNQPKLNGIDMRIIFNTDKQNFESIMCNTPQKLKASQIRKNRTNMRKKLISGMALPYYLSQKMTQLRRKSSVCSNSQINEIIEDKFNMDENNAFLQKYDVFEKIGQGGSCTVYRCKSKKTNQMFAVKIYKFTDQELIENYRNQFEKNKQLSNNSIINHEEFIMDNSKMTAYTILEYCSFKNLKEELYSRPQRKFSQEQTAKVLYQILKVLDYIHERGLCHRDIKPQNFLYNPQNCQVKMIDLDCSRYKKETENAFELWTKTGTLYYQAPEMFLKTIYTEKVDIWGAGILAYELLTGKLPFSSSYSNKTVKMIISKQIDFQSLKVSNPMKKLLKGLLQKQSTERFNAKEALEVCQSLNK